MKYIELEHYKMSNENFKGHENWGKFVHGHDTMCTLWVYGTVDFSRGCQGYMFSGGIEENMCFLTLLTNELFS